MYAQSERQARRLHEARLARVNVQRMRQLAAQRVEILERELKDAAETGLRAEISRGVAARTRLQSVVKRKRAARYAAIAAFSVVICAATVGIGWSPAPQASPPAAVPGEPLKLAFSYSISPVAGR